MFQNMKAIFSILSSTIISIILVLFNNVQRDDYWYDFYHKYYKFPRELTDSIDRMLIRNYPTYNKIGKMKIITPHYFIPDEGNHYLYFDDEKDRNFFFPKYIGLCKKREIIGTSEVYTYNAWISPFYNNLIHDFNSKVTDGNDHKNIQVFIIDTSTIEPQTLYVDKIYREPTDLQKSVINEILDHWKNPNSNNNTKVFLHGSSGIGKTFTSYGLKNEIEKIYRNNVMLYDDFNPSVVGVSIHKMLANARKDMPVIIVMNEIDVAFQKTFLREQTYDPRGSYTRDKTSFNNMLDYISTVRYVIVIYTSEKSPTQLLSENSNYSSFLRKGRIDMFIEMKDDGINKYNF